METKSCTRGGFDQILPEDSDVRKVGRGILTIRKNRGGLIKTASAVR